MSEDWPKLLPSEMGQDEYERTCLLLGQDEFGFKTREAALANGARILESREGEFASLRPASSRVPIKVGADGVYRAGGARLEQRWIDQFEQNNSQRHSCCRHPENMTLSAWYCDANEEAAGTPGAYVFHCSCGRIHRRAMMGGSANKAQIAAGVDPGKGKRPFWVTDQDMARKRDAAERKRMLAMG